MLCRATPRFTKQKNEKPLPISVIFYIENVMGIPMLLCSIPILTISTFYIS